MLRIFHKDGALRLRVIYLTKAIPTVKNLIYKYIRYEPGRSTTRGHSSRSKLKQYNLPIIDLTE